jgi:hypothetical protein
VKLIVRVFAFCSFLAFAVVPAQAQKQQEKWWYCYITVPMPPSTMAKQFVTKVFQSDGERNSISLAWDLYIGTKYAPVNQKDLLDLNTSHSPHCTTGNQINLQQMYDHDVKGGVTVVDWKYAAGQASQQVQAPKPVASAGRTDPAQPQKQQQGGWWWYCTAGPYMTGVFFYPADITTRADVDSAIRTAWQDHVTREYPNENLSTGCALGGTDQASTQRIHDHVRASQKEKVVDVDWKYVRGQNGPTGASQRAGPQTISASRDQTGQHPATAAVTSQTYGITLTCLTAKSDIPNPQPEPTCHVFHSFDSASVDLKVGAMNMFNRAETVTLTCNGPGNRVQCTAVIAPRSARNSM